MISEARSQSSNNLLSALKTVHTGSGLLNNMKDPIYSQHSPV